MERSEALMIAKLAYKEIYQSIENVCGIIEEIHGVSIECRLPEYLWVENFEFAYYDLKRECSDSD